MNNNIYGTGDDHVLIYYIYGRKRYSESLRIYCKGLEFILFLIPEFENWYLQ